MPRKPEYDKDVLIDRARDLFWKQGWAGTSMKDLERVLKMKPGSFYAAFGSKDALFALTLERYAQTGAKRIAALADEYGPLGALQRYPALVIAGDSVATKACMLAKTVLELSTKNEALAQCANQHLTQMEGLFAALFRRAQSEELIAPDHDCDALARRYQSDLLGLRVSAERGTVDAEAIAREISQGLAQLAISG